MTTVQQSAADAVGREAQWQPQLPPPAKRRLLRAVDLPRLMAEGDGRGRVVGIRQFVKDWAVAGNLRAQMIEVPPRRRRFWHRATGRRFDLARIAAVVHALCDRDKVPVPTWVNRHRARKAVALSDRRMTDSAWDSHLRQVAPPACASHNVWFVPADLDDYRVHGFR